MLKVWDKNVLIILETSSVKFRILKQSLTAGHNEERASSAQKITEKSNKVIEAAVIRLIYKTNSIGSIKHLPMIAVPIILNWTPIIAMFIDDFNKLAIAVRIDDFNQWWWCYADLIPPGKSLHGIGCIWLRLSKYLARIQQWI